VVGTPSSNCKITLAAVVAISTAAGWLVYNKLVLLGIQPFWDEAAHLLQAALIAHDVGTGDLPGLLLDSYRQVYWPPMHSWLVGGVFLLTGPDIEAARVVSVVAYVLLAPTLFLVARTVESRHGVTAGIIAAGLVLTCPGIISYAARSMLELPGLLALSAAILAYCVLEKRPDAPPRAHALLGACVVLTYLVKTNFGVLLVLAIVATKLLAVRFRLRALLTRRNMHAVLPLALFCAIWFAYPPKIVSTWQALVNRPWGGEEARGLAGLLFYPNALADLSGSWWMFAVLWIGVIAAWRWRSQPGVLFLLVLTLTLFAIGEIHHTKLDRHIMPMFPPMFVLSGIAGARLWGALAPRGGHGRAAILLLLACALSLQVATLARRRWIPGGYPDGLDVMGYVFAEGRRHEPVLVLGLEGVWPAPPVIDWHLVSEGLLEPTWAGSAMDPRQDRRIANALRHAPIPERLDTRLQSLLGRYDAPAAMRTLHWGDKVEEDREQFESVVVATLDADSPQTIISMIGSRDTTSPAEAIPPKPPVSGFQEVEVREFPLAGTRVHVFHRK
jgi:hypothetical protein